MIQVGDWVRLKAIPPAIEQSPSLVTKQVFAYCLGRTYRVVEIDHERLVLDVSTDIDTQFGGYGSDIRLEKEFLEVVTRHLATIDLTHTCHGR